jgi:hypothetical protein
MRPELLLAAKAYADQYAILERIFELCVETYVKSNPEITLPAEQIYEDLRNDVERVQNHVLKAILIGWKHHFPSEFLSVDGRPLTLEELIKMTVPIVPDNPLNN